MRARAMDGQERQPGAESWSQTRLQEHVKCGPVFMPDCACNLRITEGRDLGSPPAAQACFVPAPPKLCELCLQAELDSAWPLPSCLLPLHTEMSSQQPCPPESPLRQAKPQPPAPGPLRPALPVRWLSVSFVKCNTGKQNWPSPPLLFPACLQCIPCSFMCPAPFVASC